MWRMPGSLADHLRAIDAGERTMPTSPAKRHHFVPQFLLARFAAPVASGQPKLWKLDTTTGECEPVTPRGTAWERNLYAVHGEDGSRIADLEGFFGLVESHAAESIARLIADPLSLALGDRANIAMFLALQDERTPLALDAAEQTLKQMALMFLTVELTNARGNRRKQALEARDALLENRVDLSPPEGERLNWLIRSMLITTPEIFGLPWQLLRSTTAEFVLSDRPLTMRDPRPRHDFSAEAWLSSRNVYSTLPLDPQHCLRVGPPAGGSAAVVVRRVDRQVAATNLRTYGWATRYVLGQTKETLVALHETAMRDPERVPRPTPKRIVLLEDPASADPADAERNRARGWSEHLVHRPDDGEPQALSYRVIDSLDDVRAAMRPRRQDTDGIVSGATREQAS